MVWITMILIFHINDLVIVSFCYSGTGLQTCFLVVQFGFLNYCFDWFEEHRSLKHQRFLNVNSPLNNTHWKLTWDSFVKCFCLYLELYGAGSENNKVGFCWVGMRVRIVLAFLTRIEQYALMAETVQVKFGILRQCL